MNLPDEDGLPQQLAQWASEADVDLARRYALRYLPSKPPGLYRRLRRALGLKLRELGLRRATSPEPWLPGLNQAECSTGAKPLAIWALGMDRDTLRIACLRFKTLHAASPAFVPVLITDIADFTFFSRLGWLVEYLPTLSGPTGGYAGRKRRYLAWRYRDTPAVHASAGLRDDLRMEDLFLD